MDLLSGLKSFLRIDTTTIDNNVFRLHYRATCVMLIGFSILVTGRQYIGDPIDCMSTFSSIPSELLDTFCWIHTTFSLPDAWHKEVGKEVIYPGIQKYTKDEKRVFHAYYQWVCFVLFLQAIMFYTPRYFWKAVEGKKIKSLILGLNAPILPDETKEKNKKLLVEYLEANINNHKVYFGSYILAEIMNFVNVVGQMFLMDVFLGGEFSRYGIQVIQFTGWDGSVRYDPMLKVFPRMTKCQTFHVSGSSGDVQHGDALCVLPINIINEKIYIFLWFWFIILAVSSGLVLVYRVVIIFWPEFRFIIMRYRNPLADVEGLATIVKRIKVSDWLLLDLLSKNLDPLNFRDIVNDFSKRLDKQFDSIAY